MDVYLNRRWLQFSRLLAAEVCASALVMLDRSCSEVVWRVLATHSIHQFPFILPCVTVCHHMSTGFYTEIWDFIEERGTGTSRLWKYCNSNIVLVHINPLTPNDDYSGHTAPLNSKCCILYIYSRNIGTEYIKHGIYSPFVPLQNAVCFINLIYLIPVLFTFHIQSVLKLKK